MFCFCSWKNRKASKLFLELIIVSFNKWFVFRLLLGKETLQVIYRSIKQLNKWVWGVTPFHLWYTLAFQKYESFECINPPSKHQNKFSYENKPKQNLISVKTLSDKNKMIAFLFEKYFYFYINVVPIICNIFNAKIVYQFVYNWKTII